MEEFAKRRMLLEIWRSCCDGNTLLCVSSKTLRLELTAAFGREVNTKHADVADQGNYKTVQPFGARLPSMLSSLFLLRVLALILLYLVKSSVNLI